MHYLTLIQQAESYEARGRHFEAAELVDFAASMMGDHPRRRRVEKWARWARNRGVLARFKRSEIHVLPRLEDWAGFREFPQ